MTKQLFDLMSELIKINSIYPHEKEIGDFIFRFFSKLKYRPIRQEVEKNRDNIIVEKGSGEKSIVLYSHLDTVNVTNGWKTNPFKLIRDKDRAVGLGAWDMKSGMSANILSFVKFHPKNFKLKIIFCVDEENISKGAVIFSKSNFMKNVDCIISTEPAFRFGLQGITTGRIGRAVYEVKITGESRHTAFYEKKFDINYFVAQLLISINKLNIIKDDKKQYFFASKIESSSIGMSLPEKTVLILESSVIPPFTHDEILNKLRFTANELNKKYRNYYKVNIDLAQRETPFLDSYQIDKKNDYLHFLSKSVKEITKKNANIYFRSSVADENVFASFGKTVLSIGPVGNNAHAPNEWVSLSSLEKLYNILNSFLIKVDKSL